MIVNAAAAQAARLSRVLSWNVCCSSRGSQETRYGRDCREVGEVELDYCNA